MKLVCEYCFKEYEATTTTLPDVCVCLPCALGFKKEDDGGEAA